MDFDTRVRAAIYDHVVETTFPHRPGPDEMRAIFDRVGLHGSFWAPQSDHFG